MIIFPLIILYLIKEYCNTFFFSFIGVRFPVDEGDFFLLHTVQTGSEAHPSSYIMGSGNVFPGGNAAWA
jgi:hypothetical protein